MRQLSLLRLLQEKRDLRTKSPLKQPISPSWSVSAATIAMDVTSTSKYKLSCVRN